MKFDNIKFSNREDITKEEIDFSKLDWIEEIPGRTGTSRVHNLPPRISFTRSCIYLNRTAAKFLGSAEEVVLGWDKENKILVFRPVRNTLGKNNVPENAHRFRVTSPLKRNDYLQIFSSPLSRSVRKSIGIDDDTSAAFLVEYLPDRDMLVIDLNDPLD